LRRTHVRPNHCNSMPGFCHAVLIGRCTAVDGIRHARAGRGRPSHGARRRPANLREKEDRRRLPNRRPRSEGGRKDLTVRRVSFRSSLTRRVALLGESPRRQTMKKPLPRGPVRQSRPCLARCSLGAPRVPTAPLWRSSSSAWLRPPADRPGLHRRRHLGHPRLRPPSRHRRPGPARRRRARARGLRSTKPRSIARSRTT